MTERKEGYDLGLNKANRLPVVPIASDQHIDGDDYTYELPEDINERIAQLKDKLSARADD